MSIAGKIEWDLMEAGDLNGFHPDPYTVIANHTDPLEAKIAELKERKEWGIDRRTICRPDDVRFLMLDWKEKQGEYSDHVCTLYQYVEDLEDENEALVGVWGNEDEQILRLEKKLSELEEKLSWKVAEKRTHDVLLQDYCSKEVVHKNQIATLREALEEMKEHCILRAKADYGKRYEQHELHETMEAIIDPALEATKESNG